MPERKVKCYIPEEPQFGKWQQYNKKQKSRSAGVSFGRLPPELEYIMCGPVRMWCNEQLVPVLRFDKITLSRNT